MRKFLARIGYTAVRTRKLSYNQDGLIAMHNADFLRDPEFVRAYAAGQQTGSWRDAKIQWRMHTVFWAAAIGSHIEGDFVECGVNKGGSALAVIEHLGFERLGKTFWLYDTFDGIVDSQLTDAERSHGLKAGTYEPCYDQVVNTFSRFGETVKIVKGAIPDTLSQAPEKVAYMHIDMNCAAPEIAAAEFFWPRLSPGAMIVLDDYGWGGHIEQKRAFDAFCAGKGVTVLTLPTGQGMICKPA
jgi:hypothetical protein